MPVKGFCEHKGQHDVYTKEEVDTLLVGADIDNIRSDVDTLQTTVANNTKNITSVTNKANTNANNISANTTNISALSTKVNTVQAVSYGQPKMNNGAEVQWYQIEKVNNMVHVFIDLKKTISPGATVNVATIPAGYRPSVQKKGFVHMQNEGFDTQTSFVFGADGNLNVYNKSTVDMVYITIEATYCI
jgi:hypothetical protein